MRTRNFATAITSIAALVVCPGAAYAMPLGNAQAAPQNIGLYGVQFFDKKMNMKFCNRDAESRVAVTIASTDWRGTKVEGWYRVEPGQCRSVFLWTTREKEHHFLFWANGGVLELGPRTIEIFGFRTTGRLASSGKSFCVNHEGATAIQSNLLSPDRDTNCQGPEKITPFGIKMLGGYDEAEIETPAISGRSSSSNSSDLSTLKSILNLFR